MTDDITDALKHLSKALESLRDAEEEARNQGDAGAKHKLFQALATVSATHTLLEELHYSLVGAYPN